MTETMTNGGGGYTGDRVLCSLVDLHLGPILPQIWGGGGLLAKAPPGSIGRPPSGGEGAIVSIDTS